MFVLCSVMFSLLYLPILVILFKCSLCISCFYMFILLCSLQFNFLYFLILVIFFKCILICECTCLFCIRCRSAVQFFCIFWVERNFFSLTVFGGNLSAGDVHSTVTMDRNFQAWQWTGSISLLTWVLLWASACSLEVWGRNGVSLEKCVRLHAEWLLKSLAAGVVALLSYYSWGLEL